MDAARDVLAKRYAANKDAPISQETYEIRIHRDCMRLATSYEDVEHMLNLLERVKTFQELRVLLKGYVVFWAVLSDAAANIANEVFALGIDSRSVSWERVLKNEAVRMTALPADLAKHREALRHDHYMNLRNDVVHRGWLVDTEFDELHGEWLFTVGSRFSRAPTVPLDEHINQAAGEFHVHRKIQEASETKRAELGAHLTKTFALLEEIAAVLEPEMRRRADGRSTLQPTPTRAT